MPPELASPIQDTLRAGGRALTSAELAARLRQPRPAVEAALDALRDDPALIVREWPMTDPHFGMDRIVVAAWVGDGEAAARADAEVRCQHVYDELLRDFLASHRCV